MPRQIKVIYILYVVNSVPYKVVGVCKQHLQFRTHSLGGASAKCLMNFLVPLDTLSWPSLSLCLGDAEGDIAGVLRLRLFRACLWRTKNKGFG